MEGHPKGQDFLKERRDIEFLRERFVSVIHSQALVRKELSGKSFHPCNELAYFPEGIKLSLTPGPLDAHPP